MADIATETTEQKARRWIKEFKNTERLSNNIIEEIKNDPATVNVIPGDDGEETAMKYNLLHQIAFAGNERYLKDLAELPSQQVDLTALSGYGESIFEIARSKLRNTFLQEARSILKERFATASPEKRLDIMKVLDVPCCTPHSGLLSDLPEIAGYFPARPMRAPSFMKHCLDKATMKNANQDKEYQDWLLARLPLEVDPVLQDVVNWIACQLPVHRTRAAAFHNLIMGGSMLGLKPMQRFGGIQDINDCESLYRFAVKLLYELSSSVDRFTRASDFTALMRVALGTYCEFKMVAGLLELEAFKSKGITGKVEGLETENPEQIKFRNSDDALEPSQLTNSAEMLFQGACERFGISTGRMSVIRTIKKHLDDEITQLCQRADEFIKIVKGSVGYQMSVDKMLGGDNHLFAMLGATATSPEYGQVAFVFKKNILNHPDTDINPQTITAFVGVDHLAARRPWVGAGFDGLGDMPTCLDEPESLPTAETAGWNFDYSKVDNCSKLAQCTAITPPKDLTCYHGLYTRKLNQLHGAFSEDWELAIAREIVAGARTVFTGARPQYGGRENGKKSMGREPFFNGVGMPTSIKVKDRTLQFGHVKPTNQEIDLAAIVELYQQMEGHAHVEVHLPRYSGLECLEHIFLTTSVLQELKDNFQPAYTKLISDEFILPDGRQVKLDGDKLVSLTPETLTISNDTTDDCTDMISKQRMYFEKRYHLWQDKSKKTKANYTFEECMLWDVPPPGVKGGLSFRTESMMFYKDIHFLPRFEGNKWKQGIAVSFDSCTINGLCLAFAEQALKPATEGFNYYTANVGELRNFRTVLARRNAAQKPPIKVEVTRESAGKTSFTAVVSTDFTKIENDHAKWQRYWAAAIYKDNATYVLFGHIGNDEDPPQTIKLTTVEAALGKYRPSPCETVWPAQDEHRVSRPVLCDTGKGRLSSLHYVGFTTRSVAASICNLKFHTPPTIEVASPASSDGGVSAS